jgi:hypothetical protein
MDRTIGERPFRPKPHNKDVAASEYSQLMPYYFRIAADVAGVAHATTTPFKRPTIIAGCLVVTRLGSRRSVSVCRVDLIGQYQNAGVQLLINSDYRNDMETHARQFVSPAKSCGASRRRCASTE